MHRYEPKAYSICEVKAECFTVWIIAKVRLVKIKILCLCETIRHSRRSQMTNHLLKIHVHYLEEASQNDEHDFFTIMLPLIDSKFTVHSQIKALFYL